MNFVGRLAPHFFCCLAVVTTGAQQIEGRAMCQRGYKKPTHREKCGWRDYLRDEPVCSHRWLGSPRPTCNEQECTWVCRIHGFGRSPHAESPPEPKRRGRGGEENEQPSLVRQGPRPDRKDDEHERCLGKGVALARRRQAIEFHAADLWPHVPCRTSAIANATLKESAQPKACDQANDDERGRCRITDHGVEPRRSDARQKALDQPEGPTNRSAGSVIEVVGHALNAQILRQQREGDRDQHEREGYEVDDATPPHSIQNQLEQVGALWLFTS